ncbi:MAG: hypothetical protein JXA99_12945 [Candidatus Lokiarchaeota archaeon]|nr:hypothetical protein [Candidatus Lokiarchaeota archaeon]
MIEALRKIGELVVKKEMEIMELDENFWNNKVYESVYLISEESFNYDYFEKQVKNSLEKPHIIYICLENREDNLFLKYQGIELKEAIRSYNNNWIRKEAVGGSFYSPTIPLEISANKDSMKKMVDKALKNIIKTLIIKNNEIRYYPEKIKDFIININQNLKTNKEKIIDNITDMIFKTFLDVNISKNKINIIISIKIDNQTLKNNKKINLYLFNKFILKTFKTIESFSDSGKINWQNSKENMICSICSRINQNITTEYKPYTFYSNDKPSYNTNSNFSTNGKMFPIDIQCAYLVEIGRCYVDLNFEFNFSGNNFKLIPKVVFPNSQYQQKILDLKIDYENIINNDKRLDYVNDEEFLFLVLEDFNNTINFDMIFYEKNQAEFKILLHIKDVAPSRIKKIHNAFKNARKMGNDYRNYGNLISFYTIKRFFSRYEGESIKYDKEAFLEMLDIIFSNKKVKKSHLLSSFFSNFQNKIFKSKNEPYKARETEIHGCILIFEVLKQLNILNW